ncbi:MAG: hypothetical protein PUE86_03485 [Prevotella sp.]|nr:hypothetical protein [Prevotella sp.]
MTIIKYIKRQDCGWKQAPGCSGETSINLSREIFEFLSLGMVDGGEVCGITMRIYKDDFVNALDFIQSQLPLYRSTSRKSDLIQDNSPIFMKLKSAINLFFHENEYVDYTVDLYCRKDGRFYLKGLKQNGFSIRDYLVEMSSALVFSDSLDGFIMRLESGVSKGELDYKLDNTNTL